MISPISGVRGGGGMYVPTAVQVPSIAGGIGLKSLQHGTWRGEGYILRFDVCIWCPGWASESLWAALGEGEGLFGTLVLSAWIPEASICTRDNLGKLHNRPIPAYSGTAC